MKITRRAIVLALSGLVAAGVATGLGLTTQQVFAQDAPDAPTLNELFVPQQHLSDTALDFVQRTTGKLTATFSDGNTQSATAVVVASESLDMLLTSGKVLFDNRGEGPVEVRFVPARRLFESLINEPGPYGTWTARRWVSAPHFDQNTPVTAESNLAMVLLNTRNGLHIQQAVGGAQGLCFANCPRAGHFHVFAYHTGHDDGRTLDTTCQVNAKFTRPELPYGTCIEGNPALGAGSSGAPVIANLDPNTGVGLVVAVNTWITTLSDGKKSNGGTYLGRLASAMYEGYRRQ
ncbi:MAG TPA: hypothetical protein VGR06_09840 [Actinophytocola sp.]|jgi:hypothetical protein|uniref:trypsin-like serine peptidase n=1 Tax=Actinophytocola sp. TaxID=1872138 RepID=UPI002DFFB302|nr:hypothetical protein [Actinophytocola sp.]